MASKKIKVNVKCYSGYKANERPVSFSFGESLYQVEEIIDQWQGSDHSYFKLKANDGNLYILRYDEHNDFWELHYFKNAYF